MVNIFEGAGPPLPMAMSKGLSPLIVFRPLYIVYRKLPPLAVPTKKNMGIQAVRKSLAHQTPALTRCHDSDLFLKRICASPWFFVS